MKIRNILIIVAIIVIILAIPYMLRAFIDIDYVSSKYGKYCYVKGQEPGTIKYPVEFDTYEDCVEYLEDKQ